jgi:putative membrane protein
VTPLMADPGATRAAVAAAASTMEVAALLRHYVVPPLRESARQAGRRAALEGGAIVAVTPSPALDGVFAAFRGLLLIRQVASVYGMRPGVAVTITLIRRVIWTAASITGVELLSRALADHTLQTMPLVRHLAGAVPGTSVTALRLYRLAAITAEACSPLPVEAGGRG